jgi:hypothetical protein
VATANPPASVLRAVSALAAETATFGRSDTKKLGVYRRTQSGFAWRVKNGDSVGEILTSAATGSTMPVVVSTKARRKGMNQIN